MDETDLNRAFDGGMEAVPTTPSDLESDGSFADFDTQTWVPHDGASATGTSSPPSKTGTGKMNSSYLSSVHGGATVPGSLDGSVVPGFDVSSTSSHDSEEARTKPPRKRLSIKWVLLCGVLFVAVFAGGIVAGLTAGQNNASSVEVAAPPSNVSGGNTTTPQDTPAGPQQDGTTTESPSPSPSEDDWMTDAPTFSPTDSPTVITADVVRVPILAPTREDIAPTVERDVYDYTANSAYMVGVYYYPWHGDDFHNGEGYLRKNVVPRQYPSLGEYDDSDPAVIAEHMKMFRRANIGLLVTSWWGPDKLEDSITKDVILEHEHLGNLKVALHYETSGRLGPESDDYAQARDDIDYMCEHYFNHPNYYKIDGRPVLVVYISRFLEEVGTLEQALLTMRSEAAKCGHNLYLIGDEVFKSAPDPTVPHFPFWYFDAVTNYDIYGSAGRPEGYAGKLAVDLYYQDQAQWKKQAAADNCRYIPAVSPGYNDRGVRLENDHPALSRRLTADAEEGSLFHYQLKHAKDLTDPELGRLILVNSFNEWHEDTQIEPVATGEATEWPPLMTQGLEYVGYGNLYLDILGASTVSAASGGIFDYLYDNYD
jgi:glycoprotein endo-alpha-1,2-mannosidase